MGNDRSDAYREIMLKLAEQGGGTWAAYMMIEIEAAFASEADKCPICATPFKPTDMCLSDIEMGACHAACPDGTAWVDLNTGEPMPEGAEPPKPFPYSDLFPPRAENAQVAEPVGWVLVPREPTKDMRRDGNRTLSSCEEPLSIDVWNAMIAASPPAPQAEVTEEMVERAARRIYDLDPFYEAGEYVDAFPVSPGGHLTWEQARARDAEFAGDKIMLPVTKFAYDAARAALEVGP